MFALSDRTDSSAHPTTKAPDVEMDGERTESAEAAEAAGEGEERGPAGEAKETQRPPHLRRAMKETKPRREEETARAYTLRSPEHVTSVGRGGISDATALSGPKKGARSTRCFRV